MLVPHMLVLQIAPDIFCENWSDHLPSNAVRKNMLMMNNDTNCFKLPTLVLLFDSQKIVHFVRDPYEMALSVQ